MENEKLMTEEGGEIERQMIQLLRTMKYGQIVVTVKENKAIHFTNVIAFP